MGGVGNSLLKSAQKEIRKLYLDLYISNLDIAKGLKNINWIYDKNSYYAYLPLSDDGRLHYEFLFANISVRVSLHFEGKWQENDAAIREILGASLLNVPLRYGSDPPKGVYYVFNNYSNYKKIAQYMSYLITISISILKKYKLLKDELVFISM